jgi:hypothetical protein
LPHAPQFWGSVAVLVHAPPHSFSPVLHVGPLLDPPLPPVPLPPVPLPVPLPSMTLPPHATHIAAPWAMKATRNNHLLTFGIL